MYIYHIFITCLSVNEHLGFYSLVILNRAKMNTNLKASLKYDTESFGNMPKKGSVHHVEGYF